ncbi:sugar ABC transporter permease [Bradyrhizobium sp. U87765 SZCCT0131]|uniref:carbohydrate ABC transporter permease n=1 Tax=Bradyrhizobium sp. U87765 SZCCT0109 TaxID=2807656 RepID=UPI001BAD264C|nr:MULTISPECIES: sugar ABC transporter permease [unclassified Bradyrhizobium]MBR1218961.1 sugar ABC transporter permease [Bradyrhizobium sp. U87765 SZCCT0131]MBR1261612.1 sugar ABC transporter permease [Bradyrhizobium sp. U87765 SZCCT0134]MBR1306535.1 sugar ABC transporter permease [Bradyrhizobium sp. U87765 SZCCT0110]MBR1317394.1 sugar ABC transporter permease [Bradyrhizobium sp. U87765 SZCCT0109]MBR1351096.1 sugar ABC transporter permease [Bradyrhizobium sp. U87765 SZCCT0048]
MTSTLTDTAPRPIAREASEGADWRGSAAGYLFLTPWLLGFFGLTLGPALISLYLSFTDFDLLGTPKWIGAANYVRIATNDPKFVAAMHVTFLYVVLAVPLKLAFALLVAVVLNKGIRGLPLYRALFYLPSLIGASVAIAVLWRQLFAGDGLLNQFLGVFGITGPSWISDPDYSLYTLVALSIWQFGSPMIIFLAGLRQIPRDVYEAAEIDGASRRQQFWRITLPLLTPVVFFNAVVQTIEAFKAFTPAFIISGGSGGPIDSTLFYTLYLYQEAFAYFRMGYASALAWILVVIIAAFTALAFLSSRYWVHYDG